jgi:hypothetical protein
MSAFDADLTLRQIVSSKSSRACRDQIILKAMPPIAFYFFVRHGFTVFDLLRTLADRGQKFQALDNGVKPRIFGQSPDRIQGKLFVAHGISVHP